MRKLSLCGLSVLMTFLAVVGFAQQSRAEIDPADPFASVTLSPTPGTITDIADLQTIVLSIPGDGEYYFSAFNTLNIVQLQKQDASGNWADAVSGAKYTTWTDLSGGKKNQYKLTYNKTLGDDQTSGKYRIYIQKAGTIKIFNPATMTVAAQSPANWVWEFDYESAGGTSVEAKTSIAEGSIISEDDFSGITVSFDGATKVDPAMEDSDAITMTCNGTERFNSLSRDGMTFKYSRGSVEGAWEFSLPAGFYSLTLEDGSVIDSPAVSTYFYVGDITVTTTPENGGTITFSELKNNGFSIAYPDTEGEGDDATQKWKASLGEKTVRQQAYLDYNGTKLMGLVMLFPGTSNVLKWEPALYDEDAPSAPVTATAYIPRATYMLTYNGKQYISPEVNFSFTVEPDPTDAVIVGHTNPGTGGAVSPLSQFTLSFTCDESKVVSFATSENIRSGAVTLKYSEDEAYSNGYGLDEPQGSSGTWNIETPLKVSTPTEITISVAEGAYDVTLEDGRKQASPAISATFTLYPAGNTIDADNVIASITPTPAPGEFDDASAFNKLSMALNLPEYYRFDFYSSEIEKAENRISLQKKGGDGSYSDVSYYTNCTFGGSAMNTVSFDLKNASELDLTDGDYRIYFPTDVVEIYNSVNEEHYNVKAGDAWEYTLKLPAPAVINYTTTPAEGETVETLDQFSVNFTDATAVAMNQDNLSETCVTLSYGETVMKYGAKLVEDEDNPTVILLDFPFKPETPTLCTVKFAEGLYDLTIGGNSVASPAVEFSFTVGKEAENPEVKFTSVPAQDSHVDSLEQFSFEIEGVTQYAWASEMVLPDIKLTYDGGSMSYNFGFVEDMNINEMLLDEPLTFKTPTTVTATFAAGVYTLTMEDGSEQLSPEIQFSFTVGKEQTGPALIAPVSTTPAEGARVDELSEFSIEFADVKEMTLASETELPDITLTYGDTTLSYCDGFTEGDTYSTMVLDETLVPESPTKVTVKYAEGVFKFVMEDGSEAVNEAIEFSFTVGKYAPLDNDAWIPVTDVNQLDGAEVAIVWYYDGVRSGLASAPAIDKAAPVTAGTESCIVMNITEDPTLAGNQLRSSQFLADEVDKNNFVVETYEETIKQNGEDVTVQHEAITAIRKMPETAAIAKVAKTTEGYSFEFTNYTPSAEIIEATGINADGPFYFAPNPDKSNNIQSLQVSNTPYYNSISVNSRGMASVKSDYRDDADILSAMTRWSFSGPSQSSFCYVHQALDNGSLYLFIRKDEASKVILTPDPANNSTIEKSTGTEEITFSVAGYESAEINAEVTPVAKFNDEDAAVTFSDSYPVKATVTVPANTDGTLVINFPEGWLKTTDGSDEKITAAYEYKLNFKSKLEVADVTPAVTPFNGTTVQMISEITVSFPETVKSVELNEEVAEAGGIVTTLNGNPASTPMLITNTTFRYRPEYQERGTFTFTLKEGFYILTMTDGTKAISPEISTTVEINPYAEIDVRYTTTPAANAVVENLKSFGVEFENVTDISFANTSDDIITLSFDNTVMSYPDDFEFGQGADDSISMMILNETLSFQNATVVTAKFAAGTYMLTFDDGSRTLSPEIEFSFTVNGDTGLGYLFGDEEGAVNVYSIDGILMIKDAKASDFRQLEPGLYIVNGKVVNKK